MATKSKNSNKYGQVITGWVARIVVLVAVVYAIAVAYNAIVNYNPPYDYGTDLRNLWHDISLFVPLNQGWLFSTAGQIILLRVCVYGLLGLFALSVFLMVRFWKQAGRATRAFMDCLKRFFTFIPRMARRFVDKKPFQKRLWWDLILSMSAGGLLTVLTLFFFVSLVYWGEFSAFIFFMLFGAGATSVFWFFFSRQKRLIGDLGRLEEHLHALRSGNFGVKIDTDPKHLLAPMMADLDGIQDGFVKSLKTATKSERMKADLITNVSHDLKTPLTSIISYIELLSRMELSDEAREHVDVLVRKSERLKLLIQDVFDLAKSSSGNAEVVLETIDLARLTDQLLSEYEDASLKVNLPDRPLLITGDGAKLARVLHNLLDNAVKYRLHGTRIHISAQKDGQKAVFEMKNVANYEMDFDTAEITERFTRGDVSRNTNGSGLGLAIAKSFAEACGGQMRVSVDGDMFKVILSFPAAQNHAEGAEKNLQIQQ
ncbi:hypothetical protein FACS1894217_09890 [Clostridia bacterium]|nr:hypothetical protein FACS1894217_09890 [Clostridia bacterium]